jgi:hypothetical protein
MSDLHEAFDTWLTGGARDDLPRAVAVHASACPDCLRAAGAFDALTMIDLGAAELPPLHVVAGPAERRRGLVPATAAAIAVLLVIGAGFVAGGTLLRPPDEPRVAAATPTLAEGVLGGQGGPQASTTESATPSASPTPTPTESAQASSAEGTAAPNPTMGGGPPLATPVAPPITPRPTATPSPRPTVRSTPTPQPAPQRTPPPTPAPTPVPTPVPTPACSDTLDNDGDLLTDFPADPGCESAADDDESGLP